MNPNRTMIIMAILAAAPMATAHEPAGTPKNYCEPQGEWNVHDYGGPSTGEAVVLGGDHNQGGDCSGGTTINPGTPCFGFEDPGNPLSVYAGLCDAEVDPPLSDYDGHFDFASGGAFLKAAPPTEPCGDHDEEPHHPVFGPIGVRDVAFGDGASFTVGADVVDVTGVNPCGDAEADIRVDCIGFCTVTFLPGLDGYYTVFVTGSQGHVYS